MAGPERGAGRETLIGPLTEAHAMTDGEDDAGESPPEADDGEAPAREGVRHGRLPSPGTITSEKYGATCSSGTSATGITRSPSIVARST